MQFKPIPPHTREGNVVEASNILMEEGTWERFGVREVGSRSLLTTTGKVDLNR